MGRDRGRGQGRVGNEGAGVGCVEAYGVMGASPMGVFLPGLAVRGGELAVV